MAAAVVKAGAGVHDDKKRWERMLQGCNEDLQDCGAPARVRLGAVFAHSAWAERQAKSGRSEQKGVSKFKITVGDTVAWLVIGALARSLAGMPVTFNKKGFGRLKNIRLGLLGAVFGGVCSTSSRSISAWGRGELRSKKWSPHPFVL